MRRKKIKFKVGDVFQISLPNGQFAYGRVYRDASVGIYNHISERPNEPPIGSRDFMFIVGMYEDVLSSGQCPIIGHDAFEDQERDLPHIGWPEPQQPFNKLHCLNVDKRQQGVANES